MMKVQISDWDTPFENDEVHILEVIYSYSEAEFQHKDFGVYAFTSSIGQDYSFVVRILVPKSGEIYSVNFSYVCGYRVMDEVGYAYLAQHTAKAERRLTTVKVRQHPWAQESPGLFDASIKDGWSFLILSGDECVEVVSPVEPVIQKENTLRPEHRSIS
ncbi:hypothetical protein [Parvularcula sp. IMCC14364]|uniref:hypothetical protein n=1 Tax=Parvularcula sp. IMCC14364 TaxID=3067902 RepID=UPI0027426835|nr:hypothetical protein [Parvularcula sp. IMCC14364]